MEEKPLQKHDPAWRKNFCNRPQRPYVMEAQHDAVKCLNLLLDRGADPTIVDAAHSATPLMWAEVCDAPEAAEVLKRRG